MSACIITGGSRGIGAAIASSLAKNGSSIAIIGRNAATAQAVAEGLPHDMATRHVGLPCDVSDPKAVRDVVSEAARELGPICTLVNCAGVTQDGLILRLRDDQIEEAMRVNLLGSMYMCREVSKQMLRHRINGSLINIGSVVGSGGNAGQVAYSAAKAGLVGLTRSLAKELGPRGIRANLVEPGFVFTQMTDGIGDAKREELLSKIALRRFGHPDEVAALVCFLAGSSASYLTGQVIRVDGCMET